MASSLPVKSAAAGSPTPTAASETDASPRARPTRLQNSVRRLSSQAGVDFMEDLHHCDQKVLHGLSKATFIDRRWANAMDHIQNNSLANNENDVQELLQQGAKAFGLWRLSDAALAGLLPHIKHTAAESGASSPGLSQYLNVLSADDRGVGSQSMQMNPPSSMRPGNSKKPGRLSRAKTADRQLWEDSSETKTWGALLHHTNMWWFKRTMAAFVVVWSVAYAYWLCFLKAQGLVPLFGWPVFLARGAGMGTAILSGFMYLSMARTFMKVCYKVLPAGSLWLTFLDGHKDIHIFTGKCLVFAAALHACSHLVGSVEGIASSTPEQLNEVLFCANPSQFLVRWNLSWLQYPTCPVDKPLTYLEVVYKTMPGITGVLLVILLSIIGMTSRKIARAKRFEVFWYLHNMAIALWPVLLFFHGSNGWMGIGVPLVIWTCSIPIGLYMIDRIGRVLRYYCLYWRGAVRVVEAVVRPGRKDGANGALVNLSISRPRYLWNFEPGMYAFLCMPEYAPFQWHPFTISSGRKDAHVEFIINGVGDWTEALAQKCLDSLRNGSALPKIALDGPYPAPTQSALSNDVLVAIGAGVGITPCLSLLATITSLMEDEQSACKVNLKAAHFFWLTRSMDELLFGRRHFAKIAACPRLRECIHLHLHCTGCEPDGDAAAYLFRQAIRLQSGRDRDTFKEALGDGLAAAKPDVSLPWCWLHGGKQDVLWLSGLADESPERRAHQGPRFSRENLGAEAGTTEEATSAAVSTIRNSADIECGEAIAAPEATDEAIVAGNEACELRLPTAPNWSKQDFEMTAASPSPPPPCDSIMKEPKSAAVKGLLLPVAFGRPDWKHELPAVGKTWPEDDLHIYVCGNNQLVASLKEVCDHCNDNASLQGRGDQRFNLHYERFG
eukprot:TRINITY_DN5786_c0_g1_i5.p1 TRINITY_DN5786_c0_g1~~TRINITY_DN5786_c0_g1_i5.p1  ORF type:complete len:894 (-),score=113.88 TRINITY_DN5786_c0_g1_i5:291-2972(-)